MNYESLLEKTRQIVKLAGERLIEEWERPNGPRGNGGKADIDIEIESELRHMLLSVLSCDFWGEETGFKLTGDVHCWVIDPNDGTADFLNGRAGSAISVGLLRNFQPVLGVVYAPVLECGISDCISWAEGMPFIQRNGSPVISRLANQTLNENSVVMLSAAAQSKPEVNAELCAPGRFVSMPSIAYRLARVAAGDGVAAVSLYPLSAHDVVAGHALLKAVGGVLLDQGGNPISYTPANMKRVSQRCFGGASSACPQLATRNWDRVLINTK